MLCGGKEGFGKALSAGQSTAPALDGLYDADDLFVYVPQELPTAAMAIDACSEQQRRTAGLRAAKAAGEKAAG